MKLRAFALFAIVAVAIAALADEPMAIVGHPAVIDGDTIKVGGYRVRLFGIDAPESGQSCYDDIGLRYPCGTIATMALTGEIGSDPVICSRQDHDRYGRIVAICTVRGVDVGAVMVSRGWAIDYERYSHGRYQVEQDRARAARRGIWKGQFEEPAYWRRQHRERGE